MKYVTFCAVLFLATTAHAVPILLHIDGELPGYQLLGRVALWDNITDTYTGRVVIISDGNSAHLWTGDIVGAYDPLTRSFSQSNSHGWYSDGRFVHHATGIDMTFPNYRHTLMIPEPSSLLLALMGVLCVGINRRIR